jgi:hypothetical protein
MAGKGVICFVMTKIRIIPLMFDPNCKGPMVSGHLFLYSFIISHTI